MRTENGHREPYRVRIWEIGNELYGGWQIGHCTAEEYAERYDAFRSAMLAVDPDLHLVANGQSLAWNAPLVARKGDRIRSLSLHTLIGSGAKTETDAEAVFRSLMAYTTCYDKELEALRAQAAPTVAEPRIAITELQIFTNVPHLPNNASQAEALFLAGIIHSALRQGSLVELITHSALVNHGGGLRKERERVYANPVHWASHLYGHLPEGRLVRTVTTGETFAADVKGIATTRAAPVLDVVSILSLNGRELCVVAINRDPAEPVTARLLVKGFRPGGRAQVTWVAGDSPMSKNTREAPEAVQLERKEAEVVAGGSDVTFPAHSVSVVRLQAA
jgi:alpha-N-arabinofuranosidase